MKIYFKENLVWWRKNQRLLQSEVAEKMGVSVAALKSYEYGKATPTFTSLVALARTMGVSVDALLTVRLTEKNFVSVKAENREALLYFDERLRTIEKKLGVNAKVNVTKKSGKISFAV